MLRANLDEKFGLGFEFFHRFLISKRAGSLVKTISRISILGIGLGVASLVLVMSVMNGFNRSIRSRLLAVEPHLSLHFRGLKTPSQIQAHEIYKKLQATKPVLMALTAQQDVILRTADGFVQGAVAHGVSPERLLQLLQYAHKKAGKTGQDLPLQIPQLKRGEIILGAGLADKIGLFREDSLVIIPPETLLTPMDEAPKLSQAVVGGFLVTDVDRIDRQSFFYILNHSFPRLRGTLGRTLALEVWLKDPEQAQSLKLQLASEQVRVETWKDRNASLFFALQIEKFVVSFLVGLSTLIAGLSIIAVMWLLLTQKKKDVGNLLAMGMTPQEAKKTFVFIGMCLALTGVMGGLLTGILASVLVDRYSQNLLPAFYEETNIPTEIHWLQILVILSLALISSYLTLKITMKKLSAFNPSEILRA